MESYNEIILDHAHNPRNQGPLADANARGYQMNPVCGDTLALMLRIADGRVAAARFQAEGCTASVAASSVLTELVTGMTLDEALVLTHADIVAAVGGLPPSKLHSAALVIDALRRAITSYRLAPESASQT